jgi:hypothetical protein
MVHKDSAGFDDVVALDIDEKRGGSVGGHHGSRGGQERVAPSAAGVGTPAEDLSRTSPSIGSARLVDLAVRASGDVIALDSTGNRPLALARGVRT